jgi:hypothetical protein
MFAQHPVIAKRWADITPSIKSLPEHVKSKEDELEEGAPDPEYAHGLAIARAALVKSQMDAYRTGNKDDDGKMMHDDKMMQSNAQNTFGQLNRPRRPLLAREKRMLPLVPKDRMTEDQLEEFVSAKVRKRTQTLPGGRYPMPDKKHARLALQMINRGNLSPEEKAKVRARAHKMLGTKDEE